ncbi:hypothetical protein SARC_08526 [Sphaeroforma arctica JP610]|uniref:NB-ARC domain-containing protein n=1 Tax=Sphaeroforma arctica JP610 TaxID=667725 RepID=A0A0L0FQW2_9EUKA|nr:hypothetical protein SARC_08526 [Sphaeroforma arctica JP610]KNC79069.1 hypothetical protein SARC_08526 [Sphaeroforma arctica JP610]|eukprot:XP_014152971.1 hypothetical protein SARC_08526 [Sphaeroforma arctica JP610]
MLTSSILSAPDLCTQTRISDSWKTTPSTIRTIPDYTIDFAGREGDLHIIAEFVYTSKDSCKIVCLHGRPGCGKSQFAYRVASEFKDLFPNEEFVCDLRTPKGGTLEPRDVMAILIRSVWPDKRLSNLTDAAIKSIYISCFRQKRTILIIENASDYSSVEELIPSGVDCLCIITSRKNLGLDIQVRYPTALNMVVSDLTPTEGLELLRKFVPDIDSDVGLGLCQQSGFLPLGIRVIGGLLNHRPNLTPAMLLAKYRTSPNKRAALADRLGLREMLDLVPKDDMVALRQLSVFAGPFDGMAASCILGLGMRRANYEDAEDTLGNLLEQSLIDYDAHSLRYSQNDFLRQIVTDLYMSSDETKGEFEKISTTDDDRQASSIGQSELEVQKRFVRYYCKVIHSVQSLPTADAATDRIQSDRLNLEAAFRLAVKGGDAFRAEARDLAQGLYLYRFTLDPNTKKEVASYATNHHSMNDINYDSLSAAVQKNIPDPTLNDKMNDLAVNDSTHDPEQNVTQNATSPSTTDTAAPDATCEVGTKAMDDPSNKS